MPMGKRAVFIKFVLTTDEALIFAFKLLSYLEKVVLELT